MSLATQTTTQLAESGLVPDSLLRAGIRRLCGERKTEAGTLNGGDLRAFVDAMDASPIAPVPELANTQHYEVPAEFFAEVLGRYRKYSCCYWRDGVTSLDDAERAALEITCGRARIADGMDILDLGCGWGSLSLWIAERYPSCRVTAVSNSSSQRRFIGQAAHAAGLTNIRVITADMNDFDIDGAFDRVVSVEMFEHMRNYRQLFARISRWLKPEGLFFMHIFCHRSAAYEFIDRGPSDWMSRYFFSGGIMPSGDLPSRFQDDLALAEQWRWSGRHYQATADAWLANMDRNRSAILPILRQTYGDMQARRWWTRWRIFFLAVSEMFGMDSGSEWGVGHYLFRNRRTVA